VSGRLRSELPSTGSGEELPWAAAPNNPSFGTLEACWNGRWL